MTHTFSTRTALLGAGLAAASAVALALAPTAQAAGIAGQHYDLKADVDCSAKTITIKGENHNTEAEYALNDLTFDVNANDSVTATSNDTAKFGGSTPLRVLTQDETQAPPKSVIGVEAEYASNCPTSSLPAVTFQVVGTSTVPSGGRAASYLNASGTQTQLDTTTGSGKNVGVVTTGHVDRRWAFTTAGSYVLPIRASVTFAGGVGRSSTDNLRVAVS